MKSIEFPIRGRTVVLFAALVALPLASNAAAPADPATSLAADDGLLKICSTVADSHVEVIRQHLAQLEKGKSPDELAKLRASDAYQSAYQSVADMLGKVDEAELKKVCASGRAGAN